MRVSFDEAKGEAPTLPLAYDVCLSFGNGDPRQCINLINSNRLRAPYWWFRCQNWNTSSFWVVSRVGTSGTLKRNRGDPKERIA